MAKRKLIKRLPQTGSSNKTADAKRKALPPGRRVSSTGNTYTETRMNRSDKRFRRV